MPPSWYISSDVNVNSEPRYQRHKVSGTLFSLLVLILSVNSGFQIGSYCELLFQLCVVDIVSCPCTQISFFFSLFITEYPFAGVGWATHSHNSLPPENLTLVSSG